MTREQALEKILETTRPSDPVERRELEAWLARDEALRRIDEQQRELFSAMELWTPVEPSAAFDRDLHALIEAEEARESWFTRLFGAWRPNLAAAGLAAMIAAAVFLGRAPEPTSSAPAEATKVAISNEDAQYLHDLEGALDDIDMLVEFDALELNEESEGRS